MNPHSYGEIATALMVLNGGAVVLDERMPPLATLVNHSFLYDRLCSLLYKVLYNPSKASLIPSLKRL